MFRRLKPARVHISSLPRTPLRFILGCQDSAPAALTPVDPETDSAPKTVTILPYSTAMFVTGAPGLAGFETWDCCRHHKCDVFSITARANLYGVLLLHAPGSWNAGRADTACTSSPSMTSFPMWSAVSTRVSKPARPGVPGLLSPTDRLHSAPHFTILYFRCLNLISMATLFLSCPSTDRPLAQASERGLKSKGHIFKLPFQVVPTGNWRERLLRNLQDADAVVILLTDGALRSPYVLGKVGMARANNKSKDQLMLPVIFELREIPDFISDVGCFELKSSSDHYLDELANLLDAAIEEHRTDKNRSPRIFISHRHKD